jgi:hypothetical protein
MLTRSVVVAAVSSFVISCGSGSVEPDATPVRDDLHSAAAPRAPYGPADCEDVLVPREALPQCDGETCEQVQRERQRTVHWSLTLQRDYPINGYQYAAFSADVLEHQIDCVLRQLQNLGVEPVREGGLGPREDDSITVDASFGQIESLLRTTAVNSAELSCVEADCRRCETLTESECRADAFCWTIAAQRLDAARACWEGRYAGCYRGSAICDASMRTAISPDGACWQFSSSCVPRGFSGSLSTAPDCGYASFDSVPHCER